MARNKVQFQRGLSDVEFERLIRVLARRQHATPRSSGEGSIPLITLLFQLATTLSPLASRAAGCRVATLCIGT